MGAKHHLRKTNIPGLNTDYLAVDEDLCHYRIAPEGFGPFNALIGREIVQKRPVTLPGERVEFGDCATWQVTKQLSASTNCRSYNPWSETPGLYEAKGVFVCRRISGASRLGEEAILKVFMQLPPLNQDTAEVEYDFVPDPDSPNFDSQSAFWAEGDALIALTEGGCPVTPALYFWYHDRCRDDEPVPGGYFKIILMEKLPGTDLRHFWELPLEQREEVRLAFRAAYPHFCKFYEQMDRATRNILWDEQAKQVYFIDFEDVLSSTRSAEQCAKLDDFDLSVWGLYIRDDMNHRYVG